MDEVDASCCIWKKEIEVNSAKLLVLVTCVDLFHQGAAGFGRRGWVCFSHCMCLACLVAAAESESDSDADAVARGGCPHSLV